MGKQWALSFVFSTVLLSSTIGQITTTEPKNNIINSLFTSKTEANTKNIEELSTLNSINVDAISEKPASLVKRITKNEGTNISVWATAYTSHPSETDDTPFITASGTITRDGIAAANFLPIGTKFIMPDQFGDKIFIVEDRMNPRYNGQQIVDIWFSEKSDAKIFGKRAVKIEVL